MGHGVGKRQRESQLAELGKASGARSGVKRAEEEEIFTGCNFSTAAVVHGLKSWGNTPSPG